MNRKLDCLIVRQPFASLIAYGLKKWEFRGYDCKKRGLICIASGKGPPFKTGSNHLNHISKSFPRGFVLATAILEDSFRVTGEALKNALDGERAVCMHKHRIKVASEPLGEPIKDILSSISDKSWKMYVWRLSNVTPLRKPISLKDNNYVSTWTKVEISESEPLSKNLENYF